MVSSVLIRRASTLALCLSAVWLAAFEAPGAAPADDLKPGGPIIQDIDASNFPELRIRFRMLEPSGPESKDEGLKLIESRGDRELVLDIKKREAAERQERGVRLVVMVDSTRSVSPRDFRRSKHAAAELIRAMGPEDQALVYSLSGSARLRADMSADRDKLTRAVRSILRDGRVTRIYDSLHTGVSAARAASLGDFGEGRGPAAVVVFTDGRDENSFLNHDGMQLTELARKYRVPVYTVLYGRAANRAVFTRLSEQSGGRLISGLKSDRMRALAESLRHSGPGEYTALADARLVFESSGLVMPGTKFFVRLSRRTESDAWLDGNRVAYVPPFQALIQLYLKHPALFWPFWLVIGIGLLLILLMLGLLIARAFRRDDADEEREPPQPRRRPRPVRQVEFETAPIYQEEDPADEFVEDLDEEPRAPVVAPSASVAREARASSRPGAAPFVAAMSATATGVSREDEIREIGAEPVDARHRQKAEVADRHGRHMRAYTYQMLQNALREARPYAAGQLLLRDKRNLHNTKEYDLFLDEVVIGTDRWATIHLDDRAASPIHAKIRRIDGRFVLYDMVSGSGVYLNNRKLLRPRALFDGDEIRVGHTRFFFRGRPVSGESKAAPTA